MPFDYTNDNLINSIKIRAMVPTSQETFTVSRFLQLADEELATVIFPMMMSIKGEYFVTIDTQTMTSSLTYPIPDDAVGLKIKSVCWRDPSWPDTQPDAQIPLVSIEDITSQNVWVWNSLAYYLQENSIKLTATRSGMELRIRYFKRASKLVPNEEGGQIESIDTNTNEVTLDNLPISFEVGSLVSTIDENPGFLTTTTGREIQSIASNVITMDDVTDYEVGNWVCLDGDSTIAQVTPEAQAILAQAVAVKCLESLGDPNLAVAQGKFEQIKNNFLQAMMPRVDAQAKKVVNQMGPLFYSRMGVWRTGGQW